MPNKRDIVQFRMTPERRAMIDAIRKQLDSVGANSTDNDALDYALRNAQRYVLKQQTEQPRP